MNPVNEFKALRQQQPFLKMRTCSSLFGCLVDIGSYNRTVVQAEES